MVYKVLKDKFQIMSMFDFDADVYLFAIIYFKILLKKEPFYDVCGIEDLLGKIAKKRKTKLIFKL